MYRQIRFSCNHLQTTVDVMFPTETSLNEIIFQFGGVKKVTVSYAFGDHLLKRSMLDSVSSIHFKQDTRDSHLMAEEGVWWFSCFCCSFSCFTLPLHETTQLPMVKLSSCPWEISNTVLFITAVLHSCGANVLYIQMSDLVTACVDFVLWFFSSFGVLFASLRCLIQQNLFRF